MDTAPALMKAWRTHEFTRPSEALKLDMVPVPDPGPAEVRVRVLAISLNLNDLERIKGGNMMMPPPLPCIPGMEVMGIVDACGPGTEAWLGKRVAAGARNANGGFAEYCICPSNSVFDMPDSVPLPDAAAIFHPFHVAWLGLYDRADIQPGQTVLIQGGAGSFGSAAVQLARLRGARIFATVGHDAKRALCEELGAEIVLNYRTDDYRQVILDQTGGKGVDVVFDLIGEPVMEKSMDCVAYNGTYLMMGFAARKAPADEKFIVPRRVLMGNFKLGGALIAYAHEAQARGIKQAMGWNFLTYEEATDRHRQLLEWLAAGKIRATVGKTVRFEDVPAAFDALADRDEATQQVPGRVIALI